MEIKNFVKVYDNVLPLNLIGNIVRFANQSEFEETRIGGDEYNEVNFNIRKAYSLPLTYLSKKMTNVHWFNLLGCTFDKYLKQYKIDNKIIDSDFSNINDIQILKYFENGFYKWHVDHFSSIPRTFSCILFLNDDYKGGTIAFRNPDGTGEWEVKVKAGRLIIWPSNFLYPHTVKPVLKGTRYTVVAWAL